MSVSPARHPVVRRFLASATAALFAVVGGAQLLASVDPNPGRIAALPIPSVASTAPAGTRTPSGSPVATAPLQASPVATPSTSPSSSPGPPIVASREPDAVLFARLDALLAQMRVKLAMPGVSATILFADGRSWSGASGLADVARRIPMRPSTPFALASISKTFTAALILQLVTDGNLGLDSSVARILPEQRLDPRITVRMLLDHTSGLNDYFLNPKIDPALTSAPNSRWIANQSLAYVRRPYFAPGTGFGYSNTNYLLLGLIAERVTGQPIAFELRRRFFDPLGLKSAAYQGDEAPRTRLARAYRFASTSRTSRPIDISGGSSVVPFLSVITASGAAGSVAASSVDVARWAQALYGGKVLRPAVRAAMVDDAERATAVDPNFRYGLGVEVLTIDGRPSLGHDGRYLGVQNVVRYFPEEGLTIAVMTNQSRKNPTLVLRALLALASPVPRLVPDQRDQI